jgi:RNA polymerase sigma-70 factor (ECF subfamily)
MDSEHKLISRAKAGDLEAFAELVRCHQHAVRACISSRMHSRSEAEDLAQETFLTAFRRLSTFDHSGSFRAWLRGIAHNQMRNHWRKHRATPVGAMAELDVLVAQYIDNEIEDDHLADRLAALRVCIGKMGTEAATLVRWRYCERMPIAEICSRLDRKHSAVTMTLHRVRGSLRKCIEAQMEGA